jgi:hypothetical protein
MSSIYTYSMKCANECGSTITVEVPKPWPTSRGQNYRLHGLAEMLGWTTVDEGPHKGAYCDHCIQVAAAIQRTRFSL